MASKVGTQHSPVTRRATSRYAQMVEIQDGIDEALEALAVALEDFLGDEDVDGRIPVALGFHRNPVTPASNAFALSPRAWE